MIAGLSRIEDIKIIFLKTSTNIFMDTIINVNITKQMRGE